MVCLVPGASFFYLTGQQMKQSERATLLLLPKAGEPLLVAPELEAGRLAQATSVEAVFTYRDGGSPAAALGQALASHGVPGIVGVEFIGMRLLEKSCWDEASPGTGLVDAGPVLAELRLHKDAQEIAHMERAVEITERALSQILGLIMPGVREREIQQALAVALIEQGAEDQFLLITSGPGTAEPHSTVTDRVLVPGDLLWIDVGARSGGYWADITRTFPVDQVEGELAEIFYIVYEAQHEARRRIRPHMTCHDADAICRNYIASRGYGRYFIHRTGHGLGIEVHEPPYIVAGSDQPLEPGMTFTVEPGIYLPGRGGVRIEDDILVTENGCRSLSTFERNFFL